MPVSNLADSVRQGIKSLTGSDKKRGAPSKDIICEDLPFEAAEAYKLLRANLSFSLPETGECRVIGVTSAVRGEGKSTVSINLAYTIAQSGKNVILIDSDMRLPSMAKKMNVPSRPGLSNAIVGLCKLQDAVRKSGRIDSWDILPAGSIPPNPSELLGTDGMKNVIEELKRKYDYIIVDLPPVTIVSDAMVVSQYVDGYIVVVRQDYTERGSVQECMRQMKVIESKVLGFVVSASTKTEKSYYRYAHRYGYGYRYGYYRKKEKYSYDKYGYTTKSSKDKEFVDAAKKATFQSEENTRK